MNTTKRMCAILCVLVLLSGCEALAMQSPEAVVASTSQRLIDALKENRASLKDDPKIIYGLIDSIVVPHFDVDYVVRLVLGKYWREASSDQQQRFTRAFRVMAMNLYAKALLEYSGEKVTVVPVSGERLGGTSTLMVHSQVSTAGSRPIDVQYRMHKDGNEWKVIDFSVENVSLVLNYKHTFAEIIQSKGLDALIDSIETKNAAFTF